MDLKVKPPLMANVGDEVNFRYGRFKREAQGIVKEVWKSKEIFTNRPRTRYIIQTHEGRTEVADPHDLF